MLSGSTRTMEAFMRRATLGEGRDGAGDADPGGSAAYGIRSSQFDLKL